MRLVINFQKYLKAALSKKKVCMYILNKKFLHTVEITIQQLIRLNFIFFIKKK